MLTKKELAYRYSPDLSHAAAVNRLMRWIKGDRDLMKALKEAGYRDNQRIFTARQVKIIEDYLE